MPILLGENSLGDNPVTVHTIPFKNCVTKRLPCLLPNVKVIAGTIVNNNYTTSELCP